MKTLQTILIESILGPKGPAAMDEGSAWTIYKALDKLPKPNYTTDRAYYWSNADRNSNNFWRTIKQNVNLDAGIKCNHLREVLHDQSGFAVPYPLPRSLNILAAWDRSSDKYILVRTNVIQASAFDPEKIQKAGFRITGSGMPVFESFNILHDEGIDLWDDYIMNDFNGDPVMFFPCSIDMNLIEKTLESKAKGVLSE